MFQNPINPTSDFEYFDEFVEPRERKSKKPVRYMGCSEQSTERSINNMPRKTYRRLLNGQTSDLKIRILPAPFTPSAEIL